MKKKNINNQKNKIVDKKKINELLKINNTKELLYLYDNNNNYDFVYKIIEIFISQKIVNKQIINFLLEINNINIIYNILEKIIENIKDIMLDIPDANNKILYIIDNIEEHPNKENIVNILKKIEIDNSSDSDDSDY